jgi:hypothetical protein
MENLLWDVLSDYSGSFLKTKISIKLIFFKKRVDGLNSVHHVLDFSSQKKFFENLFCAIVGIPPINHLRAEDIPSSAHFKIK